jgi:NADH dehydrogenase FAD-containing subunit
VFQITPPRAFRYDTLVIAVGSVTNDFGTPGASQYALPLETPVHAMRFNRPMNPRRSSMGFAPESQVRS